MISRREVVCLEKVIGFSLAMVGGHLGREVWRNLGIICTERDRYFTQTHKIKYWNQD